MPRKEHWLQALFAAIEKSPVQIGVVGSDGRFLHANAKVREFEGMAADEIRGMHFSAFFQDPVKARELFEQALRDGTAQGELAARLPHGGEAIEQEFYFNSFRDEAGGATAILIIARDVSRQKSIDRQLRGAAQYARSLLEASLDPLVTISNDGKVMDVNQATEKATGCSRETLIGSDFSNYFTEPDKAREGYKMVFSQGHVNDYPLALRHASGEVIDVLYNASIYHDEEGRVAGVFAAARDVTQLKRSQRELEAKNREIMLLGEMSGLLQSCSTVQEACPIVTATLQKFFPGSSGRLSLDEETDGGTLAEAGSWGMALPEARNISPQECWALRRGRVHDVGLGESINPPCHALPGKQCYVCIPLQAHGHVLGIIQVIFDGTELPPAQKTRARSLAGSVGDAISLSLANLRLRERLHSLSLHDPLTGLYNRRFMEEQIAREISRMGRLGKQLAVAMMDLDHFKDYNDNYGHDAGDAVLKQLARLAGGFRLGSDVVCRFGGEEFVIVLPEVTTENALRRLDKFRESMGRLTLHHHGDVLPPITVSIGVAMFPDHGASGEALLKQADKALYRAKKAGRNRVEMAEEAGTPRAGLGVHAETARLSLARPKKPW